MDDRLRIVAPVTSPGHIESLAEAGADEVYCGYLPTAWRAAYDDADTLSRRQGSAANLTDPDELRTVASRARALGLPSALALNMRYTSGQMEAVLAIARLWEDAGGSAVLVSHPGVLIGLERQGSHLARHVSLLANITNSHAVAFFRRWNIRRAVLPRDLAVPDMAAVAQRHPDIEFEAMVLNDRCVFVDGLCGFYHGRSFPGDGASRFAYAREGPGREAVVYAHDLCYAGHGCQVPYVDESGRFVPLPWYGDAQHPACAACRLADLFAAGIRYLKIGGRGLPPDVILNGVRFVSDARAMSSAAGTQDAMRELYRERFGHPCRRSCCYYGTESPVEEEGWR